ncbi:FAD-binding protein [Gammaproteobacteria bacterium]|jgi:FAD/FMN-containing dehydrogenase|nr:FAD-binding protein [Gammaproteobacteria bacterium]
MDRRRFLQSSIAASVIAALPTAQARAALQALTQVSGDVRAVTGERDEISLERAAVQELADSLRGNLLLPGNAGYDEARRVLNKSIDRHPALIVQPTGVADIQNAVNFARERRLLLAVKCGGHSFAGKSTCDGGMQIDLSLLRHARIDPMSRKAYVAGGSLLAALDHEAMAHGLVTPAGTVSHTGVGGLSTAGGFGRISRRFGLTLDNIKGVDIVTADGRLAHANAEENPELYWGVRGGGGNFGIVTSFHYTLHPMQRQVIGGDIVFPLDRAHDLIRFYADFSVQAPDDLYIDFYVNATASGQGSGAGFHVCYSGPEKDAETVLAPIRKLGEPAFSNLGPIDYVALQRSWDYADFRNIGEYLKSGFVNEYPDSMLDAAISGFEADPGRNTMLYFQQSGGAIGRVPVDATAFPHRKALAAMMVLTSWPLDTDGSPHMDYLRDYWSMIEPRTDGYYTVDSANESSKVRHGNYQGNFPRLLEVKKKYDPDNLFRLNANIAPA